MGVCCREIWTDGRRAVRTGCQRGSRTGGDSPVVCPTPPRVAGGAAFPAQPPRRHRWRAALPDRAASGGGSTRCQPPPAPSRPGAPRPARRVRLCPCGHTRRCRPPRRRAVGPYGRDLLRFHSGGWPTGARPLPAATAVALPVAPTRAGMAVTPGGHCPWWGARPLAKRDASGAPRGGGARPHLPHMHAEHHEQNHAVPLFLLPGRAQQPTAATTSAWQGAHTGYRPDVPVGAASRPLPPPAPPPAATGKRPPPFCHTQLPPTVSSPSPRAVPTASHRPQASAIAAAGPPAHRRCADPLTLAARGRPRRALLLGSPKPQLGLPVRRPRRRRRHFPVAGQAAPTVPRVAARHVCMAAGHTARRLATRRWPVRRLPRPAGSIPPTHSAALGPGPLALRPSAACRRRASPPPVATAAAADSLPGPPRLLCPVLTGSVWPAAGCAASDCSWAPWRSHREDVKGDSAACQHCSLPEGTLTTCYARCLVGYLLRGPRPAWVTFTKEAVVSTS